MRMFSSVPLDTAAGKAIYLQLADAILAWIRAGKLEPGQKLLSSRELAELLGINRITVSRAYEELQVQGWVESATGRGTFVTAHIPGLQPRPLRSRTSSALQQAGFTFNAFDYPPDKEHVPKADLHLDDGYPDPRQAPLKELYRAYRNQLTRSGLYHKFGSYGSAAGPLHYRQALSEYLNETRGLKTTEANILSVRGTLMGINLVCTSLLSKGDIVVSGIPGWKRVDYNFRHAGVKHIGLPVDEEGLPVDELRKLCRKRKVRLVYVTPHHHYPTTVSMRIDRRLELLRLANEYGFIILEDDYDFEFHFRRRPLLPLASADEQGMVIYCGSFSKSFSPAFRMGYLVASENVIAHLAKVRLLLDRQGDHVLDNSMAALLDEGTVQRYLRRVLPVYQERRDFFCGLLQDELGGVVRFQVPEGGMSVWAEFDRSVHVATLSEQALRKGLLLSDGRMHVYPGYNANAIRMGFASSSKEELAKSIAILSRLVRR